MFDLSWGEMALIGVVALVVLGPKELPNALRTITNLTKTARKLAGEFQSGVNEIVREADLEDARKVAQSISTGGISKGSISKAIEKAVDPTGDLKTTIKGVEAEAKAAASTPPVKSMVFPQTPVIASPSTTPAPAPETPAIAAATGTETAVPPGAPELSEAKS